jgi:hypothetical protein
MTAVRQCAATRRAADAQLDGGPGPKYARLGALRLAVNPKNGGLTIAAASIAADGLSGGG